MEGQMKKKGHSAAFKFKVALEAVKGEKTAAELCKEYGIFSSQIFKWRKALIEQGASVFEGNKERTLDGEKKIEKLHETIGRLKVENDFLEKCLGRPR